MVWDRGGMLVGFYFGRGDGGGLLLFLNYSEEG